MKREIKSGEVYRHFKGHMVTIINTAIHSETRELMVIYRKNDTGALWVRPFDMFISEVDHEKYPDVAQKYRFEKV